MFNDRLWGVLFAGVLLLCTAPAHGDDGPLHALWTIGVADGRTQGLALAPDDHRRFAGEFANDALFVIGTSTPAADWPYVQPGPVDTWAGSRPHVFSIIFGLEMTGDEGPCRLDIDLADTHSRFPPELEILCNDHFVARHATPPGDSDRSIVGEGGRPHHLEVEIAPALLREGINQIDIRTADGSWMLYDAVALHGTPGVSAARVPDGCYVRSITPRPCLARRDGAMRQLIVLDAVRAGGAVRAQCEVNGQPHAPIDLQPGRQEIEIFAPAVIEPESARITLRHEGRTLASAEATLQPVRRWVVHLLHFSHLDIGYTHEQAEVEQRQMGFLDEVQEYITASNDYPPEARFRWVPEGLWPVESYLAQADETKRRAFIDHVKAGRIWLGALYDNPLSGLHCEEELMALVGYANRLRHEYGLTIDSAMLTDVPGCTWGIVPVLARSGVKYLSMGPNPNWRVGRTRVWDDRPFYWRSPCGQYKVLCWMSGGYGWFRSGLDQDLEARLSQSRLLNHLDQLEKQDYPYDLYHVRYDVWGDNGYPDPKLPDTVKRWNERFAYPRLVISTPSIVFPEFERRYGDQLPVIAGDFTPYWEDGAASTAADTALNRRAAERLIQAQALWAMLDPAGYPASRADAAWREALLYDEHTWGAHNSISEPDSPFAVNQAARKRKFAADADSIATDLLEAALNDRRAPDRRVAAIEVFNTNSWPRCDLAILPRETDLLGDVVRDADGEVVPSQRLSSGELAFLAADVPALGSARFTIHPGEAPKIGRASARGASLANGLLTVTLDPDTGAITDLRAAGIKGNLVDTGAACAMNEYIYIAGRDPNDQKRIEPGAVTIEVLDNGPLVATVRAVSTAPGASRLVRDVRLVDGLNHVDLTTIIDKLPIRDAEAVHLAFPFNVPDPDVRMDMPWSIVRPELDQIEGACKNFFTVQRWVDLSNAEHGVTWATVDAPLVQMGAIRTDIGPNLTSPEAWLAHIEPSATLFSYVMNNYWETNYKADQDGAAEFRYAIRPHAGACDQAGAARFGIERNRPLVAIPARADGPPPLRSLLTVRAPGVIVTSLKPGRGGEALIARLFNVCGTPQRARLTRPGAAPAAVYLSDADETRGDPVGDYIELPGYGIATVRIER
jgi:alpha-mannosidase